MEGQRQRPRSEPSGPGRAEFVQGSGQGGGHVGQPLPTGSGQRVCYELNCVAPKCTQRSPNLRPLRKAPLQIQCIEMRPHWSPVSSSSNITIVLIQRGHLEMVTHTETMPCEDWSYEATSQGITRSEERGWNRPFPRACRGSSVLQTT